MGGLLHLVQRGGGLGEDTVRLGPSSLLVVNMNCYIWYSDAVPNVTAHLLTASVPIAVPVLLICVRWTLLLIAYL